MNRHKAHKANILFYSDDHSSKMLNIVEVKICPDVLGVFKKFHLHLEVYDSTDTNAGFGIVSILGLWILAHWIVLKNMWRKNNTSNSLNKVWAFFLVTVTSILFIA